MNENFKIAKILDEYTLIVNGGSEHGVEKNDEFQILDKEGSEVRDPETNKVIGHLDLIKDTVTVTDIYEKMCICDSQHVIKQDSLLNAPFALQNQFTEKQKLNIDLNEVTGGLRKSNEKIKVGDAAKLIKTSKK